MSVSWPLNDGDRFPSSGPLAAADAMSWDNQEIDDLIAEVTVDAYGDDEQLSSFEYAFEELDVLPDATVIGEVVEVLHIWYDGDERRGLIARCRRNGQEYPLSLLDLAFPGDSEAARLVAAYRRWLGLDREAEVSDGSGGLC